MSGTNPGYWVYGNNNGKSSGSQFVDQQNACCVPHQFVDGKEEKIRKKRVSFLDPLSII